jgi:spermidine synthase
LQKKTMTQPNLRGDIWDQVTLKHLLQRKPKILYKGRVKVYKQDARIFLTSKANSKPYNVIIVDFPDPSDKVLSKLYTKEFFQRIVKLLTPDGIIVIQSSSTEDMPRVYWNIYFY